MRFIDSILKDSQAPKMLKDSLDGIIIIDCTNVGQYYYAETDQEDWDMPDFPNIAPPFEHFWLDFKAPAQIVSEKHGTIAWDKRQPSMWGFQCIGTKLTRENIPEWLDCPPWGQFQDYFGKFADQATWGMDMFLHWHMQSQLKPYVYAWRILIQQDGTSVLDGEKTVIGTGPVNRELQQIIEWTAQHFGVEEEIIKQKTYSSILPYFHTALLSMSFMHCKNVSLDQITPTETRTYSQAAKKRGAIDYTAKPYKVLNITPMKQVLRSEGKSEREGTKKALHICRGHFANYQEGRGLFGKYHGNYWIPMHVKGSKARGVVSKDYKLQTN